MHMHEYSCALLHIQYRLESFLLRFSCTNTLINTDTHKTQLELADELRSMWHESSSRVHQVIPPLCRQTISLSAPALRSAYCLSLHPPPLEINPYIYQCIFSRADFHRSPPTCLLCFFSCHLLLLALSAAITLYLSSLATDLLSLLMLQLLHIFLLYIIQHIFFFFFFLTLWRFTLNCWDHSVHSRHFTRLHFWHYYTTFIMNSFWARLSSSTIRTHGPFLCFHIFLSFFFHKQSQSYSIYPFQ